MLITSHVLCKIFRTPKFLYVEFPIIHLCFVAHKIITSRSDFSIPVDLHIFYSLLYNRIPNQSIIFITVPDKHFCFSHAYNGSVADCIYVYTRVMFPRSIYKVLYLSVTRTEYL